jgi:glycosyltransferase involved in cell wall biosynthesis
MNVIATQRAMGYANHFKKFGFEPTFITHQRTENNELVFCEKSEILKSVKTEDNKQYKVYRFRVGKYLTGQLLTWIENSNLNKFGILFSWAFGHLDTRGSLLSCKLTERHFLKHHLKTHQYDVMMGIFSPHYHLSNCHWAHKKFKIPYVLDYRDLWDERITISNYSFSSVHKIRNYFAKNYWIKWNGNALFHTITSKEWSSKLTQLTTKNGHVITNGFEWDDFFPLQEKSIDKEEFKIVHIGSLYNHQKIEIFLEGLSIFITKYPQAKIKLYLIGALRNQISSNDYNAYLTNPEIKLNTYITNQYYELTHRIGRQEALQRIKQADLLYFPGITEVKGRHFGKIFEYIASGVKTVVAPSDSSSVEEIILETGAGEICNSAVEVCQFLEKEWNNWGNNLNDYLPNQEAIGKYTRESQTERYAHLILDRIVLCSEE